MSLDNEIEETHAQIGIALESAEVRNAQLEHEIDTLRAENAKLSARVAELEAVFDWLEAQTKVKGMFAFYWFNEPTQAWKSNGLKESPNGFIADNEDLPTSATLIEAIYAARKEQL